MTSPRPEAIVDAVSTRTVVDHEALPPGTRFGEMEILRVVAAGGFGIVYLARDHSLDRDVAVKEFMPSQLASRGSGTEVQLRSPAHADTYALGLRSFVNEAKLLARFNHPAMVKVYRFWEANGTGYMVMPYLRGPTLREVRCSMSEAPTEAWMRSIIDPLLDALEMLHAQGVFHRDIAPDNVLVPSPSAPVLLDFGAARRVIGDRTQTLTAILKPSYAPIEQYAEATQLRQGPWTDLYALAAVVLYLIDGVPPPPSTARSIHDEMPLLAPRRIRQVSATFLSAIDWALAVRPQDRPQSVSELRAALEGHSPTQRVASSRRRSAAARRSDAVLALAHTLFPTTARMAPLPVHVAPAAVTVPTAVAPDVPRTARWGGLRVTGWQLVLALLVVGMVAWQSLRRPAEQPVLASPMAAPPKATPPIPRLPASPETEAGNVSVLTSVSADMQPIEKALPPDSPDAVLLLPAPATPPPVEERRPPKTAAKAQPVRQAGKAKTARTATNRPPTAARTPLPSPREVCADRFFEAICVSRRCDEPRYQNHPQCAQFRKNVVARGPREH